jgi:hypothetical protein
MHCALIGRGKDLEKDLPVNQCEMRNAQWAMLFCRPLVSVETLLPDKSPVTRTFYAIYSPYFAILN